MIALVKRDERMMKSLPASNMPKCILLHIANINFLCYKAHQNTAAKPLLSSLKNGDTKPVE